MEFWKMMYDVGYATKEDLRVAAYWNADLTKEQYKEITGEEYAPPANI